MGCNTSQGAAVVDPSEKPEDRPETAPSSENATAVETIAAEDKDVEPEENESSS